MKIRLSGNGYVCSECGRDMQFLETDERGIVVGVRRHMMCVRFTCVNKGIKVLEPEFDVELVIHPKDDV